jgi:hypothetical protein
VCVRFAVDTELVKRKKEKKRRATKDIFGKEMREDRKRREREKKKPSRQKG